MTSAFNWKALERAKDYYARQKGSMSSYTDDYRNWLLTNWGIDHGTLYIKVVDEEKYMCFLLKWA